MDTKKELQASLKKAIEEWIENECQGDTWPDTYVPHELANLMTDVAIAVLESAYYTYHHMLDEGFRLE